MAGVQAGRLSIEIVAEVARLQNDLDKAKRAVKAASGDIARSAKSANDNLASIGKGAGAGIKNLAQDFSRLKASLDPAWASMQRFNEQQKLGMDAFRAGAISREQLILHMRQISAESKGVTTSAGQQRGAMQQLGFQINDIATQYASGTKASQIFAQQSGQVIQAVSLLAGGTSRFAAFMGTGWGIALTAATVVLVPLIANLFKTKETTEDLVKAIADKAQKEREGKVATEAYNRTLDGRIDKERELTGELEKQIKSQRQLNREKIASVQAEEAGARGQLDSLREELAKQHRRAEQTRAVFEGRRQQDPNMLVQATFATVEREEARVRALQDDIKRAQGLVTRLQQGVRMAKIPVMADAVEGVLDPVAKATQAYTDAMDKLNDAYRLGKKSAFDYGREAARLARELKAVEDAAKSASRGSGLSGRQVSASEAAGIARSAGLQVNSSTRTFAEQKALFDRWVAQGRPSDNPVAPPGSSAHEGAKGRWALDIQFGQGVTPQLLRKVFSDQGVNLTKVFKERGHFHVEGSRSDAASAEAAQDRATREAEREREQAIRRLAEYASLSAGVEQDMLQAKMGLIDDQGELARLAKEQVGIESDKYRAGIEAKQKLGDLTEAQALQLLYGDAIAAAMKVEKITRDELRRQSEEALKIQTAANDNQKEVLQLQEQMAVTQAERRRVQLSILALEKENERNALNEALKSKDAATRAAAAGSLGTLDQRYSLRDESVRASTAGPLERYLKETDPRMLGERAEALVVQQLEYVQRGISDAIAGALGVQDPLLRGLIEMFIEQVLIRPIAQALQQAQGGASGGGGGWLGQLLNLGVSVATGGVGGGGEFTGHSLGGGFARGTDYAPGGMAWVGEEGPELMNVPRGAQVFPANVSARMAANSNQIHKPTFVFPGVTNAKEAREAAGQAAHRYRRAMNGPVRGS